MERTSSFSLGQHVTRYHRKRHTRRKLLFAPFPQENGKGSPTASLSWRFSPRHRTRHTKLHGEDPPNGVHKDKAAAEEADPCDHFTELRGVHTVGHVHAEEDAEDLDDDHQRSDLIVDGPVQEVGGAAGKGDRHGIDLPRPDGDERREAERNHDRHGEHRPARARSARRRSPRRCQRRQHPKARPPPLLP